MAMPDPRALSVRPAPRDPRPMSDPPLLRGQALDDHRLAPCPRPPHPRRWFVLRQFLQTPPDCARRHASCHRHRGNATITRSKRRRRRETTAPFVEIRATVENRSLIASTPITTTTYGMPTWL